MVAKVQTWNLPTEMGVSPVIPGMMFSLISKGEKSS